MKTKELYTWEEFESNLQNLSSFVESHAHEPAPFVSPPLFRGHGDSTFKLKSTLDRIGTFITPCRYHEIIRESSNIINNCFELNWDIPEFEPPKNNSYFVPQPEVYAFMVYLRHNGFPSPLLDWTRSPYIAAFFAFNSHTSSDYVAIFSYIEYLGSGKSGSSKDAAITSLGPNVKSHKRHYLQQSEYTICTKKINNEIHFAKYEEVIVRENHEQDLFIKFTLPACEKEKVLAKLDQMNINSYSLFGTVEALMNTLSNRYLLL